MTRIFISYRRADSAGHTGRLYDHLLTQYHKDSVFLDVVTIQPGEAFAQSIERALAVFDVAVIVIGQEWVTITDQGGRRRLHQPDDIVRGEVAAALRRHAAGAMRVFPVLVGGAQMPRAADLPPDLWPLVKLDAVEITHARFDYDVQQLIDAIGGAYGTVMVLRKQDALARLTQPRHIPGSKFNFDIEDPLPVEVFIDGRRMCRLREPKDHILRVEAGVHTISVYKPGKDSAEPLRFRITGGQTIVFQYAIKFGNVPGMPPKIVLERVDVP